MTYFSKISVDSKDRYMYEKRKESILEKVSLIESSEQKGRYEKAIEVAQNAIENNLDDNIIRALTGLSLEEIKELRK